MSALRIVGGRDLSGAPVEVAVDDGRIVVAAPAGAATYDADGAYVAPGEGSSPNRDRCAAPAATRVREVAVDVAQGGQLRGHVSAPGNSADTCPRRTTPRTRVRAGQLRGHVSGRATREPQALPCQESQSAA